MTLNCYCELYGILMYMTDKENKKAFAFFKVNAFVGTSRAKQYIQWHQSQSKHKR